MVICSDDVWQKLLNLVAEIDSVGANWIRKKIVISRETDLVLDLGLIGDDAFQFMELYSSCFEVLPGDYIFSNYFESEGLWLLPSIKKKK